MDHLKIQGSCWDMLESIDSLMSANLTLPLWDEKLTFKDA